MWEEVQAKYAVVNLLVVVECLGKLNECFDMQIASRESTAGVLLLLLLFVLFCFVFCHESDARHIQHQRNGDGVRSVVSA